MILHEKLSYFSCINNIGNYVGAPTGFPSGVVLVGGLAGGTWFLYPGSYPHVSGNQEGWGVGNTEKRFPSCCRNHTISIFNLQRVQGVGPTHVQICKTVAHSTKQLLFCREYKVLALLMFKSVELLHILRNNSSSICREYKAFAPPMFKSVELLHISQTECLRLRILAQAQADFFSCIRGTGRVLVDV